MTEEKRVCPACGLELEAEERISVVDDPYEEEETYQLDEIYYAEEDEEQGKPLLRTVDKTRTVTKHRDIPGPPYLYLVCKSRWDEEGKVVTPGCGYQREEAA